ncbi:MAG TPA: HNH endonuclease signature motif containing protein [Pyrinomonadaceae bacterium]|jgi:hypothetical protein|nr:HNH endonuclease signature motif containing protein [Pyrinomonadaceae bacterium]
MQRRKLGSLYQRILTVLEKNPQGISINQIRLELGLSADEQQHLDRRVRYLDSFYDIERKRKGREVLYVLRGELSQPLDAEPVDKTTRGRILHLADGRCQMCGRSTKEIVLHIDHRIPREWGGKTEDDNLWAICSECNEGKRSFFSSITDPRVQQALVHSKVHVRIGELLKSFYGQEVSKSYIRVVAHTHDDFEKRLRELRLLGWKYICKKRKSKGRVQTFFVLLHWEPWPAGEVSAAIRQAEMRRAHERRST